MRIFAWFYRPLIIAPCIVVAVAVLFGIWTTSVEVPGARHPAAGLEQLSIVELEAFFDNRLPVGTPSSSALTALDELRIWHSEVTPDGTVYAIFDRPSPRVAIVTAFIQLVLEFDQENLLTAIHIEEVLTGL